MCTCNRKLNDHKDIQGQRKYSSDHDEIKFRGQKTYCTHNKDKTPIRGNKHSMEKTTEFTNHKDKNTNRGR